jgi:hypothetical protein
MTVSFSALGRVSAAAVTAVLAISLSAPANAIPVGAPAGSQDFVSSGSADVIYGSGSDTTYTMQQQLSDLFNRAPGCALQNTSATTADPQDYSGNCSTYVNTLKAPGFANYDRDLAVERYFLGSGGGRNNVVGWNQGTTGYAQADYFRSSSIADLKDARYIAFAKDALAPFTFDTVKVGGNVVDSPAKNIAALTTTQVSSIFQGTIKCWASIDKTVSSIYNTAAWAPFATDNTNTGALSETAWQTAATAAGAGYASSDAYKACVPIAVYTVPTTSGTRSAWDSLAAGGTGKGAAFLSLNDPFTGAAFTTAENSARLISENNAAPIAGRESATDASALPATGVAAHNTDLITNAIYFYSVGRYSSSVGGADGSGNPSLSGNSTNLTGYTDRLFNVTKADNSTPLATAANIADGTYAYARSLYVGYQYPNQATRNYLDPVNGFLCSTITKSLKDPINSLNVRAEIDAAIAAAGFITIPAGEPGGGRNVTYLSTTGDAANGATSLSVASATGVNVGQGVFGTGIAAGTTVAAVSGTTVTLSAATTGALSAGAVNFKAVSHCRQDSRSTNAANNDTAVPTVGEDTSVESAISTAAATAKRPIQKVAFSKLVSGVVAGSSIGLQDASGTNIPAEVKCYNARLALIDCLPATSPTNYNLSPLQFVKKVTLQPTADLAAGSTYKVYAKGIVGQAIAIQDRHGLTDWPIVDGQALTDYTSGDYSIAKDTLTVTSAKAANFVVATGVGTGAKAKTVSLLSLITVKNGTTVLPTATPANLAELGARTWTITGTAGFTRTGDSIKITKAGTIIVKVAFATTSKYAAVTANTVGFTFKAS